MQKAASLHTYHKSEQGDYASLVLYETNMFLLLSYIQIKISGCSTQMSPA